MNETVAHQQVIGIKVPKIYWNLTRKAVLTMEWLDGIKLTDGNRLRDACLNRKQLIDEVIEEGRGPKSMLCLSYLLFTIYFLVGFSMPYSWKLDLSPKVLFPQHNEFF